MSDILALVLARFSAVMGDRKGVTVVEYAVLVALIITVVAVAATALQAGITGAFTAITAKL